MINNGEKGPVWADVQYRGNKFHGYISANELIKIAAEDGTATLCLAEDLYLPVRVGPYKNGRASIKGEGPKRGAAPWSYCEPARSYRAEGDPCRGVFLAEINGSRFVLSEEQFLEFAGQLVESLWELKDRDPSHRGNATRRRAA
jgi:hypothetical protein